MGDARAAQRHISGVTLYLLMHSQIEPMSAGHGRAGRWAAQQVQAYQQRAQQPVLQLLCCNTLDAASKEWCRLQRWLQATQRCRPEGMSHQPAGKMQPIV